MLIEKDIKHIFSQLAVKESIHIPYDGSDIVVRTIDDATKLSLSVLVYEGGNYIPPSVRSCLSRKSLFFHPSILTYLSIDEHTFQIRLNYLGQAQCITHQEFKDVLEEFSVVAEKWRIYLDDHDKNDLIYVRVKH